MTNNLSGWKSYDALNECLGRDATSAAENLHCSSSLVNKWRQAPSGEDLLDSGTRNPLDRLEIIITTIEKIDPERAYVPIKWLNARFGFIPPVKLPEVRGGEEDLIQALLEWTREFGETSKAISESLKDRKLTPKEYERVRREMMEDIETGMALLAKFKERVK